MKQKMNEWQNTSLLHVHQERLLQKQSLQKENREHCETTMSHK